MDKRTRKKVTGYCLIFAISVIVLTVVLLPYVRRLSQPAYQDQIQSWINRMGVIGWLIVLGIQIIQVVIAFIPGEPVEILSGALYGTVGGLAICLIGCIVASTLIFALSARYGKRLLYFLFSKEAVHSWKWLQDSRKADMVTFILFFIPGTPKDMLTYVIGITEMSMFKFISISTLARIPSVLSSTMIGSTARQGDWEISLLIFFVTGLVGIVGIGFKGKIISFCRKQISKENGILTKCECLDFVEAAHRNKVYPLMYCRMEIIGNLDVARLKNAIEISSQFVPEILYSYNFRRGCFVNQCFTVDDTVIINQPDLLKIPQWDLGQRPQLQIVICGEGRKDTIIIGMSHILTDGEGFLQYLYLLASIYNGEVPGTHLQNKRKIAPILKNIHVQPPTEQTKNGRRAAVPPLRSVSNGTQYFCLNCKIAPDELAAIQEKAKKCCVSLNDVFMTAYVRVIAHLQNINKVVIPCPADLRRFQSMSDNLTVANMTGIYKHLTVEISHQHTFTTTLMQVHIEMTLQKSRYRCFAGIKSLNCVFNKVLRQVLAGAVKATYRLLPASYTNIGIVDHNKLHFTNSEIISCYLTGTYRLPPDFQLTISTFQNVCTLNSTLVGTAGDDIIGQRILDQVKLELLKWVTE